MLFSFFPDTGSVTWNSIVPRLDNLEAETETVTLQPSSSYVVN